MLRREWLLLALNYAGERGLSPVQLQKSLFLLGTELKNEVGQGFYHYVAHNYGPFCRHVYADAEQMAQSGLVVITHEPGSYAGYYISPAGRDEARALEGNASGRARAYLREVVEWVQKQSFSGLVRAIYDKYPEYRVNSVFQY